MIVLHFCLENLDSNIWNLSGTEDNIVQLWLQVSCYIWSNDTCVFVLCAYCNNEQGWKFWLKKQRQQKLNSNWFRELSCWWWGWASHSDRDLWGAGEAEEGEVLGGERERRGKAPPLLAACAEHVPSSECWEGEQLGAEVCLLPSHHILASIFWILISRHLRSRFSYNWHWNDISWDDSIGLGTVLESVSQTEVSEIWPCCSHGPAAMDLPHGILWFFWDAWFSSPVSDWHYMLRKYRIAYENTWNPR